MTIELQMLFGVAATLLALLAVQGALVPINQGFGWGLGPRDEPRDITRLQGRMKRVVANHIEGMAVFAVLILVAHLAAISSGLTETGAVLFLLSRLGFAALYLAGVPVLRSAIWGVGVLGLVLIGVEIAGALY